MRSDAVGAPAPHVDLRIADDGEVQFKSPGMFVGYFREAEKTREALTPDGYVKTGDAGFIEPDGQLKIIDRAKDVGRLADGPLFAPKYIENKLKFFPDIREAVAIGDGREFVAALLNIEIASVGTWAERNNVAYASYQELAGNPRVYAMIERHVDAVNRALAMRAGDGGRADQALPHPAQGARRRRRRADAHPEGAPRLHRRALSRRWSRASTTARPRLRSPPRSPTRTAARGVSSASRASSTCRPIPPARPGRAA